MKTVVSGEARGGPGSEFPAAAPVPVELVRVDWGRFPWLRHGFSTRGGGVSEVYGGSTLNLGWTPEDGPDLVRENRRRLVRAAAGGGPSGDAMRLVTARQVHADRICVIDAADSYFEGPDGRTALEGDGLMTDRPGLLLGIGTADCVPVLVVDRRLRAVAAFHAGWRGTVDRIVEKGIRLMTERYGSRPEDLQAAIGPSIGPCCYAVGKEVRERFDDRFSYGPQLFENRTGRSDQTARPELPDRSDQAAPSEVAAALSAAANPGQRSGGMFLDLWNANRRQLLDAGLRPESIAVVGECTACARESEGGRRYFSHRAEQGVTGRLLSVIGIVDADRER